MTMERIAPLRVLSGATHVGQNVLATLAGRGAGLVLSAASSVADGPRLFDFEAVHTVPPVADSGFEPALLRLVDDAGIDPVIPCRDADVKLIAGLRSRRPDLAPRPPCASASTARILGDKWLRYGFAAERALPSAETLAACNATAHAAFVVRHGFPLIAKPRRGWASMSVVLVDTLAQLGRALARLQFVVQPFLGDPRTMADFLARRITRGVPLHHDFRGVNGCRLASDRPARAAADQAFESSDYRSVMAGPPARLAREGAWRRAT